MRKMKAFPADFIGITRYDLLEKAALYKGLKLHKGDSESCSEPFKIYTLDQKLLAILSERGIKGQNRPDCKNEIFTLVDENPQEERVNTNYWNFDLLKGANNGFDLRVIMRVKFKISVRERGIVFWPYAHGPFVSAGSQISNFRMFKALTESDKDAPEVAKELAKSNGSIVTTWTDIKHSGIRNLGDLFAEFAGANEAIKQISHVLEVFDPDPNQEFFIDETNQPKIFKVWHKQLDDYCKSLIIPH